MAHITSSPNRTLSSLPDCGEWNDKKTDIKNYSFHQNRQASIVSIGGPPLSVDKAKGIDLFRMFTFQRAWGSKKKKKTKQKEGA